MMGVSPGQVMVPRTEPTPERAGATDSSVDQPSSSTQGAVASPALAPAPASTAARKPKAGAFGRTMLGAAPAMPPSLEALPEAAPKTANGDPQSDSDGNLNPGPGSSADLKGRTMLGIADRPAIQEAVRRAAAMGPDAVAGRTMLGAPEVRAAAQAASLPGSVPVQSPSAERAGEVERPGGDRSMVASNNGAPLDETPLQIPRQGVGGIMVTGFLAMLLLGAALWAWSGQRSLIDGLHVSVVASAGGEEMLFQLGDVPAGASIEFGGQTRVIEGGEARFALSVDSLKVGENVVVATVVFKDGSRESANVPLHVDYRLRVDTAPLRGDEPAVELIATATPGSKVTLDGVELVLDEQGRGSRHYPVDVVEAASTGLLKHVVKYRLDLPSGEPVLGELLTQIPVTAVQLDSPGAVVVTDRDFVELAGLVAKGVQVTVAGDQVQVNEQGRFLHRWQIPGVGEHRPRLVARAANRAPVGISLSVSRVESLVGAAQAYAPKMKLTYAKIAQNPAMYKGQRVEFEGRVFNVKTERGRGVLQMLVRGCAKGRQCSLWVTYPATTQVVNDSWVRVIGDVDGEQQFRSKRDEVVTVPKVQALFVLPKKR